MSEGFLPDTWGGGGGVGFNCCPKLSHQRCLMMAALKAEQHHASVMWSERDSERSCMIIIKKARKKSDHSEISHCYCTQPQGQNTIHLMFRREWLKAVCFFNVSMMWTVPSIDTESVSHPSCLSPTPRHVRYSEINTPAFVHFHYCLLFVHTHQKPVRPESMKLQFLHFSHEMIFSSQDIECEM